MQGMALSLNCGEFTLCINGCAVEDRMRIIEMIDHRVCLRSMSGIQCNDDRTGERQRLQLVDKVTDTDRARVGPAGARDVVPRRPRITILRQQRYVRMQYRAIGLVAEARQHLFFGVHGVGQQRQSLIAVAGEYDLRKVLRPTPRPV